ncbi:MAG: AcrR family transcriptional regulator [Aureispira sp.]|jgi:AcrR family transcriptional regulator
MSPRSNEENERIRNESKAKIMAAALELFADNGYHKTSISKVAQKAGISKGLTYNYFDSKEALLEEILQSIFKESMNMTENRTEQIAKFSPKELLAYTINSFFELLVADKKQWSWVLSLSIQVSPIPKIKRLLMKGYKTYLKQIEAVMELNGYDKPELEAKLLGATFDGISIQYVLFEEEYNILCVQETLIKKYCG